jgi:hypothetical protein
MSRVEFLEDIAEKLISRNREWEVDDAAEGINAILGGMDSSCTQESTTPDATLKPGDVCSAGRGCVIEALEKYNNHLKKTSKKCQICEYERRGTGRYKNVLFCLTHGIRACGISRPPRSEEGNDHLLLNNETKERATDLSWILGDESGLTCMEKFHMLYLPQKLFKVQPTYKWCNADDTTTLRFARILPSSELYKARQQALGIEVKERPKTYNKNNNNNGKKTRKSKPYADDSSSCSSSSEDTTKRSNEKKRKVKKRNNKTQVKDGRNNNKKLSSEDKTSEDSSETSPLIRRSLRTQLDTKKKVNKTRTHDGKNNKEKNKNKESSENFESEDDERSDSSEWDDYNKEYV